MLGISRPAYVYTLNNAARLAVCRMARDYLSLDTDSDR